MWDDLRAENEIHVWLLRFHLHLLQQTRGNLDYNPSLARKYIPVGLDKRQPVNLLPTPTSAAAGISYDNSGSFQKIGIIINEVNSTSDRKETGGAAGYRHWPFTYRASWSFVFLKPSSKPLKHKYLKLSCFKKHGHFICRQHCKSHLHCTVFTKLSICFIFTQGNCCWLGHSISLKYTPFYF